MNKLAIILSRMSFVLLLSIGSLNAYAQQVSNATQESRISNADLIKLATKAPMNAENYASEADYYQAKEAWIKENPDAHSRIVGKKPSSGSPTSAETMSSQEQQQIKSKEAWIKANPEQYAAMLKGTGSKDTPE